MYDFLGVANRHHSSKLFSFWDNSVFCMLATDRQTNKQMDSIAALKCGLIIVKFQLRSYINLRLTESSLYNRFCIERSTKMGFWGVFLGRRRGYFVGTYIRPQNCAFSDMFGPDLTHRAVKFCMGIAICHRRKFGQVWGSHSQLPYQMSQENSTAGRHPLLLLTTTWKNRNHSAM